jgi:protein SCO1/2
VRARIVAIALVVTALSASLAACTSSSKKGLTDTATVGKFQGAGLVPPEPRPAFTLTDTKGQPYPFQSSTAGQPTLLYFGYTHCPDICPTTMADIAQAIGKLSPSQKAKVRVVFVTTDPKQDTGPVIQAWLSHFDPGLPNRFVGLTGTQTQIAAAQAAAGVFLAEDEGQQHATDVLLYGSDDYAHVEYLQSDNETDQIAHDLPLVGA